MLKLETCVAGSYSVDVVPQESKIYGSMLPTATKEDSDGVSLQTAKPLDDHQRNTHDNEPKSHMVFLEKRLSRGGQLGTSPAVDKNPEKHLAGTSSHSKDCRSPLVRPLFLRLKRKLVLWI